MTWYNESLWPNGDPAQAGAGTAVAIGMRHGVDPRNYATHDGWADAYSKAVGIGGVWLSATQPPSAQPAPPVALTPMGVIPAAGGVIRPVTVAYPPPQSNTLTGPFGVDDTLVISFVTPASDTRGHELFLVEYGSIGHMRKLVLKDNLGAILKTTYSQTPAFYCVVGDVKYNTNSQTVRLKPNTQYTVEVTNRSPDGSSSGGANNAMRIDFNN